MGKQDSFGEVVQFLDGCAYGITPKGNTVFIGSESDVRAILGGKGRSENRVSTQIIELERKLQRESARLEKKEVIKETKVKVERHKKAVALGVAKVKQRRRRK